MRLSLFVGLLLTGLAAGCATRGANSLYPPSPGQPAETICVLHRGLHTGLIVRARDIPPGVWPQHQQFPQAEYLEVGWGDTLGYRYPWTARIVLSALFHSKGSVLLIHAFSGSITNEYADVAKKIIAVRLSEDGFGQLCRYIQDAYALDPHEHPIPLPSRYSGEDFFRASGHYSMVNNCNNWTARALRTGGYPVHPRCSLFPGILMHQVRRFGYVVWPSRPSVRSPQSAVHSPQSAVHSPQSTEGWRVRGNGKRVAPIGRSALLTPVSTLQLFNDSMTPLLLP